MSSHSDDPARPVARPAEPALREEDIIDFLRRHPDFLARNIDRLTELDPPARYEGGVIDLQKAMVHQLRGRVAELKDCAEALIHTSRSNMSVQARTHAAVLALLGASGFDELVEVTQTDLPIVLDVDVVSLCLEPAARPNPTLAASSALRLKAGGVDAALGEGRETRLSANIAGAAELHGSGAGLVRSEALVRLRPGEGLPSGLLTLGSRDPEAFQPGQGTELLGFLARVMEHCVRRWLMSA